MAFDPNLPQENTPLDAAQMRSQLNGLKAFIDAILTVTAAQVDAVNTLPPGDPASAGVGISGGTLHLTFDIPAGQSGPPGEVTTTQMDAAISSALATAIQGTAQNPGSVQPLSVNYQDPVTASDLNQVKDKLNELIAALYRAP